MKGEKKSIAAVAWATPGATSDPISPQRCELDLIRRDSGIAAFLVRFSSATIFKADFILQYNANKLVPSKTFLNNATADDLKHITQGLQDEIARNRGNATLKVLSLTVEELCPVLRFFSESKGNPIPFSFAQLASRPEMHLLFDWKNLHERQHKSLSKTINNNDSLCNLQDSENVFEFQTKHNECWLTKSNIYGWLLEDAGPLFTSADTVPRTAGSPLEPNTPEPRTAGSPTEPNTPDEGGLRVGVETSPLCASRKRDRCTPDRSVATLAVDASPPSHRIAPHKRSKLVNGLYESRCKNIALEVLDATPPPYQSLPSSNVTSSPPLSTLIKPAPGALLELDDIKCDIQQRVDELYLTAKQEALEYCENSKMHNLLDREQHNIRMNEIIDSKRHVFEQMATDTQEQMAEYVDGVYIDFQNKVTRMIHEQYASHWQRRQNKGKGSRAQNTCGHFDNKGFKQAALLWQLERNSASFEFESLAFRTMISFANPKAEAALWSNHSSMVSFATTLYNELQTKVVRALSASISKVHITFNNSIAKATEQSFFCLLAHYADPAGNAVSVPIALPPHVAEPHRAELVSRTLQHFFVSSDKLGYFVLNRTHNDTTIVTSFAADRQVLCASHILELIGQKIIFGKHNGVYASDPWSAPGEILHVGQRHQDGPLGLLLSVIDHINTPEQHERFKSCQRDVGYIDIVEPIKPAGLCWRSCLDIFERGLNIRKAITAYATFHIAETRAANATAVFDQENVPPWMHGKGFASSDWIAIGKYVEVLQLLKHANNRLQAPGDCGGFGALYEVIPVLEGIIMMLDKHLQIVYDNAGGEQPEAVEDQFSINLSAAREEAVLTLSGLSERPAYYAATILHPRYKSLCKLNRNRLLQDFHKKFLRLWSNHQPLIHAKPIPQTTNNFDRGIDAILDNDGETTLRGDEYTRWFNEPQWTRQQHQSESAVKYWQDMREKYPRLTQLALDYITIPAFSGDHKRDSPESGDISAPQRHKLRPQLMATLTCIKEWSGAGFGLPNAAEAVQHSGQTLDRISNISARQTPPLYTTEDEETETEDEELR